MGLGGRSFFSYFVSFFVFGAAGRAAGGGGGGAGGGGGGGGAGGLLREVALGMKGRNERRWPKHLTPHAKVKLWLRSPQTRGAWPM